jgi:FMN-dependent NADH-azoreductase
MKNILRIDGSARYTDSVTRRLADQVVARLQRQHPGAAVTRRDLATGLPHVTEDWIAANFTPAAERSPGQREVLALSDALVAELKAADAIVLAAPMYNFSVPAAVKAWIDQVCRAGETFRYTAEGPVGLLADRPVYLVLASGGVPVGSAADYASDYLRHVFGFIGIRDVRVIAAERVVADPAGAVQQAEDQLASALGLASAA